MMTNNLYTVNHHFVRIGICSLGNSFFMLSCRVQGKGVLGNRIELWWEQGHDSN